jgi:transglutaminase-like putative cysteine protease
MLGMNLEMVACDRAFALSDNDVVDFLERLLTQCPEAIADVESKKSITYHLKPADAAKVKIPSTDNQTVQLQTDGTISVTVKPIEAASEAKFPYKGDNAEILELLKPTRYLQSDDETVMDLARRAVSGAKDAATAVGQIESFVNGYITAKNLSVGYATAADVAGSRQGDCSEHAVLAAAICRAAGIPAKVVSGIVYVPSFAGRKDVFIGHAWAEALVGDKWICIDPTRAPGGFGAGHIALAAGSGDPVDFFSMLSTLGYFTIEKVVCE